MTPPPQERWTPIAGWCVLLAFVWLLGITSWTWLDNRGQPWLGWALELYVGPPLFLFTASLLAWWGRGWVRRVGWGLVALFALLAVIHLGHALVDHWTRSA